MISFDDAVALLREGARPLGSETVPLADAHRRTLAEGVQARTDSPPCDCSAMDGYAVRDADLAALPARLPIAGQSFAGAGFGMALPPRRCVRVFTGAPVPPGADRVVIQEEVERDDEVAIFSAPPGTARHVRPRGSDFAAGDLLLERGQMLDARALVTAAAADRATLEVGRRPRLVILASGDELAAPGTAAATPGAIPESVSFGVAALAEDWGGEIVGRKRLGDDLATMAPAAEQALDEADVVVVTGGASVGEKDFAKAMFEPSGLALIFSKVAIKPGKPVWLGRARERFVVGLPGNPTSALVTARLFLAPLLAGLTGRDPDAALNWKTLPLAGDAPPCGARETFLRARRLGAAAEVLVNQDSSAQRTLAAADLLVRRRANAPAAATGEHVAALDF